MAVTLKNSVGSTLSSTLQPLTNRQIVKRGDGTVTTAGATGFDVVTLANATLDTAYGAASAGSPILLGVDDVGFKPLQYPELSNE
jgi:hypothetical protein